MPLDPQSARTHMELYLTAAVCTSTKFGPPPEVVKSLWKGLSNWRVDIFKVMLIMTEELLVHAGILVVSSPSYYGILATIFRGRTSTLSTYHFSDTNEQSCSGE